ncbi:MAG: thioredoxin [Lachnospiraceae bacterium]|nr:thioredoxin [Lachnospiraceae bacterium]
MLEVILTKDNFEKEVIKSNIPVLVDFYADWCGPCKALSPVISEIAKEYDGKVKVCKLNIDTEDEIADSYNVMSVPTLLLFKEGKIAKMMVGYRPKKDIENLIS